MKDQFFRLNRWDGAVCVLVILLALGLAWSLTLSVHGQQAVVEITLDGEVFFRAPLSPSTDQRVEVPGEYPLVVRISEGQVWVETSQCPGGDCRLQGKISQPGQTIACLPDRVTIALRGETAVDLVVG